MPHDSMKARPGRGQTGEAAARLPWTSPPRNGINARARPQKTSNGEAAVNAMKTFLLRFFTWWNGQTFGTQVWTRLYGEFVGTGRVRQSLLPHARRQDRSDARLIERRWVIYNGARRGLQGAADAGTAGCTTPWTCRRPLDKTKPRPWEKPHRPNLTGTPYAHRPSGSTLAQGRRPKATGDYKAWTPG